VSPRISAHGKDTRAGRAAASRIGEAGVQELPDDMSRHAVARNE
jgi:hypothetical protein